MSEIEAADWTDGEYPTEAALERIEHWEGDLRELMAFVHSIWWAADWGWNQEGDDYYVSTGGWSGNEDIIGALRSNFLFWSLHHRSTRAGGHFMFCFHSLAAHDLCGQCKGTGLDALKKAT
ncbi:hypothetical protein LCGC14_3061440 [marine sediment metagenome]|uniref:Uncharacterized protein n=1 Tax=marine sediment metagenome TaxID=412755 RepID=A0A0F8WIP9_9ZZZZ